MDGCAGKYAIRLSSRGVGLSCSALWFAEISAVIQARFRGRCLLETHHGIGVNIAATRRPNDALLHQGCSSDFEGNFLKLPST